MSIRTRSNATPWAALLFALLGLAWCGYVAFPTGNPAPCATSGCALFRDSRIAGISLWWVGGAYFFLLAIVCLRGNRPLARLMAMVALFLDSVLLVVMFFTAPCFDCLVVAVFLGLTYYHLRSAGDGGWFVTPQSPSLLLPIWFGLLLGNAVLAINEQLPLTSMGNSRSADVRNFFSPSCKACRAAILASGNAAALYPVEEKDGDIDSIIRLGALLKANVPLREALPRSIDPNEPMPHLPFYERMLLSVQLVRNKAVVLRQGFRALPMIQINGMPVGADALGDKREHESPSGGASSDSPVYNLSPSYADPPASGGMSPRNPSSPGNARGQGDGGNLPDFLHNADDLSRCAQGTGQPCP